MDVSKILPDQLSKHLLWNKQASLDLIDSRLLSTKILTYSYIIFVSLKYIFSGYILRPWSSLLNIVGVLYEKWYRSHRCLLFQTLHHRLEKEKESNGIGVICSWLTGLSWNLMKSSHISVLDFWHKSLEFSPFLVLMCV